ncbi:cysteine-rich and transmembrane domain-containing protein WIH1-like [Pistacia vera]|uniref:cysteine-rich and transmembrane domain-containing protein WIH1-like n=1 Tax=Pistacia vera TaxID=55513 RepID=UPI00126361DA|nr:cysteine-rich and transmembrane domain-containing protein WIH1-like [Pistacia vera]
MAHYDHQQAPVVYPPPPHSYPPPQPAEGPYVTAPPPIGYPTKEDAGYTQHHHQPVETRSRGDDFWKGCFAALCCCCVLDVCCC